MIAERAAEALRAKCRLIANVPHNLIEVQAGAFLHRNGAAKADIALVPIAGSRDTPSFLVKPTANREEALSSLAHRAGRKYNRSSMTGPYRSDTIGA
ncbi:RtcB family protein [Breoghania sp.]|uniref:RtcB family protein n=1 Tax=Breoghania sp. TaxID=2065378 RepID=UPI003204C72A